MRFYVFLISLSILILNTAPALASNNATVITNSDARRSASSIRNAYTLVRNKNESRCGWPETKIHNTLERDIIELKEVGIKFIPLLLTNKSGKNYLQHKFRTACINRYENGQRYKRISENEFEINLSTRISPRNNSDTLIINTENMTYRRENDNHHFYILFDQYGVDSFKRKNRLSILTKEVQRYSCENKSLRKCETEYMNYVERIVSKELRRQIAGVKLKKYRSDHREIDDYIADESKLIRSAHSMIVANESAVISPFQVWDAIYANSGISFGAKQWDYGSGNKEAEFIVKEIFGDLLSNSDMEKIKKPIREFDIERMLLWQNVRPDMNDILKMDESRKILIDKYVSWLKSEPMRIAAKLDVSINSAFGQAAVLYYLDATNQYGSRFKIDRPIKLVIDQGGTLPDLKREVEAYMLKTKYARKHPSAAKGRLRRTWGYVEDLGQ